MVKFNQIFMDQIIAKVKELPSIKKLESWHESNQAENMEYHVMITQVDDGYVFMKHYRWIQGVYDHSTPPLVSMEYNSVTLDKKEFEFIKSIRKGAI